MRTKHAGITGQFCNGMMKVVKRTLNIVQVRFVAGAVLALGLGLHTAMGAQLPVGLGTSGDFTILAKSGISSVPNCTLVGDIGVSPIASTAITGFSLVMDASTQFSRSAQVNGKVYAANYGVPTPTKMTTAVSAMEAAYTDAAGRALPDAAELGSGNIGGLTITNGLYKWSTGVTIPNDVTLSGGPNDVWIFQIAGDVTMASGKKILLSGGAQAKNIFWQVGGGAGVTIGTTAHFEGVILSLKAIHFLTGSSFNGRLLAQSAVTLDQNAGTPPDLADLSLTKTVNNATPNMGANVIFTITVTNSGPNEATGVTVKDQLPAGLLYVSSSGAYVAGTGIWTIGSLSVGASTNLTITATVTNAGVVIVNMAQVWTADGFDSDSTPGNSVPSEDDQASVTLTVSDSSDLALTKTVDNPTPLLGGQVTYTIVVTNKGPSEDSLVTVKDVLPAGLVFVSASSGAYDLGTGMWGIGALSAGASTNLTITATVMSAGSKTNVAQVWTALNSDPNSMPANNNPNEDDQGQAIITVQAAADLALAKTVDNPTPELGSNVVFTISVTNVGPDAATGVSVLDLLPEGLVYVSDNGGGFYTDSNGVWTIGGLNVGISTTLQITATVTNAGQVITNIAQVSASDQFDPNSVPGNSVPTENDQGQVLVFVGSSANLSLTKTVNNAAPALGSNVIFTITVTNAGPNATTGVTVKDLLPAGLNYVSSSGSYVAGSGIWTIGGLGVGVSTTLTISATVTNSGSMTNVAQVMTSDEFDPNSIPGNSIRTEDDQASAIVTVGGSANLSLTKTVNNATPNFGTNVIFTVTVTNSGPNMATGLTVKDVLPAGLGFVSSSGGYVASNGIWTIGSLNVGSSATLLITASVTNAGVVLVNMAQVWTVNQFDPNSTPGNSNPVEDDQASVFVTVLNSADLALTKTVNNTTPLLGSQITYTIVVTNRGPNADTLVSVKDILPAGLTFVSASTVQYVPGTGLWTIGAIPSGSSVTLTITATVMVPGVIVNIAQVWTAALFDRNSTPGNSVPAENDQAQVTVTARNLPPTPVTLKLFAATYDGNGVRVGWETGVELENLGFNVYRSTGIDGARFKLNTSLISGMGTSQGQAYELRDQVPDTAVTYCYWLEDVSWKFETKMHGPALLRGTEPVIQGAIGSFVVPAGAVSRVSFSVMKAAGLPVATLDPAQLKVTVAGKEVAAYVSATESTLGVNDYVLFNVPAASKSQKCTIGISTNALRMTLVFARPSRASGDVWTGLADEEQTLNFAISPAYVRYLLGDFVKTPVWVMDVSDPADTKLLYGFSYITTESGLTAVYLSYPESPLSECVAVGDEAVYDVPTIQKTP